MYRFGIISLFLCCCFSNVLGQTPAIEMDWGTYIGSGFMYDFVLDDEGNMICVGGAQSGFPTTPNAYDSIAQLDEAVIFKLDKTGSNLIWSTFLGGNRADRAHGVKLGPDGSIYVVGSTQSTDFPTSPNAFQPDHGDGIFGNNDVFVAKLSPDGQNLLYASYYGGLGDEYGWDLDVNADGEVFVTGFTYGGDLPVTPGAFDETFNGAPGFADLFVFRANADASSLIYSTYVGGNESESGHRIIVNENNEATFSGAANSFNYPTTPNAIYPNKTGSGAAGFVSRLSADGSQLLMSTYISGNMADHGEGLAMNADGDVYIVGRTYSTIFPISPNAYSSTLQGNADGFLTRISADGTTLQYSTYFGGFTRDIITDVEVADNGEIFIIGNSVSYDMPMTDCTWDSTWSGGSAYWGGDVFIAKFDSSGQNLMFSTYLGGFGDELIPQMALDNAACAQSIVVGCTSGSVNYPTTPGAYKVLSGGSSEMAFSRFSENIEATIELPTGPCPQPGEAFPMSVSVEGCGHWSDLSQWEWNFGDGSTALDAATTHVYQNYGDYMVTTSLPDCPEPLDTVDLSLFGVDLGPDLTVCLGEEEELDATVPGAVGYVWHDGSTDPLHAVDRSGTMWVDIVNDMGCTASDSVEVELLGDDVIVPPNVFSPNDDGINDAFFVTGIADKAFSLAIYDRWGVLLYSNSNYNNDWKGGDLPEGTYYYVLESPDLCGRYLGWVALLR